MDPQLVDNKQSGIGITHMCYAVTGRLEVIFLITIEFLHRTSKEACLTSMLFLW